MKSIMVYDVDAKLISKLADRNDTTEAEIVEMLCEYVSDMVADHNLN